MGEHAVVVVHHKCCRARRSAKFLRKLGKLLSRNSDYYETQITLAAPNRYAIIQERFAARFAVDRRSPIRLLAAANEVCESAQLAVVANAGAIRLCARAPRTT